MAVPVVVLTADVAPVTVLLTAPVVPVAAVLMAEGLLLAVLLSLRGAFLAVGGDVLMLVVVAAGVLFADAVETAGDLGVDEAMVIFSEADEGNLGVEVMAVAFCLTDAVEAGDFGGGDGIFFAPVCCVDTEGPVDFFATPGLMGLDFVESTGEDRSVADAEALSAVVLGGDLVRIMGTGFLLPIGECVEIFLGVEVGESGVGGIDFMSELEVLERFVFCAAVAGADLTAAEGVALVGEMGDFGLLPDEDTPVLGMADFFVPSAAFNAPFGASF